MSDDFKLQFSVKTPRDSMLNIRADNQAEFEQLAAWALQNSARFIDLETAIKGVPPALAANVQAVAVQQSGAPAQQYQQQQPQFVNEPQGPAPVCIHGPMNFKSNYSKKKGKNYSGYFCSADQCKPENFQWAS